MSVAVVLMLVLVGGLCAVSAVTVVSQWQSTFGQPKVSGPVRYTERFVPVKGPNFTFWNRAHLVIHGSTLTVSICRLLYRYWPQNSSVFEIALDRLKSLRADDGTLVLVDGDGERWEIRSHSLPQLSRVLSEGLKG